MAASFKNDMAGKLPVVPPTSRTIKSFVRRQGRLSNTQIRALQELAPQYLLPNDVPLLPAEVFGRDAPLWLEIGFGNGDTLLGLARAHPEINFIGIEVHTPGLGRVLQAIATEQLSNLRLYEGDASLVLQQLPDASLARLLLLFPDPWHKPRHHKRRLVQAAFADLVVSKLQSEGIWHLATDWQDYAKHMQRVLQAEQRLRNLGDANGYATPPAYRIETRFEQRGKRLGHGVWDLLYARQ